MFVCVLQDVLIGEEGLSEEERARRKAERRKAKRKVRGVNFNTLSTRINPL